LAFIVILGNCSEQATEKRFYMTFGRRSLFDIINFRQRQSCRSYTQYSPFLPKETFREMFSDIGNFFSFLLSCVVSKLTPCARNWGSAARVKKKKVHGKKIADFFVVYHSLKSFVRLVSDKGWNFEGKVWELNFKKIKEKFIRQIFLKQVFLKF
jgi:hypothetical protein